MKGWRKRDRIKHTIKSSFKLQSKDPNPTTSVSRNPPRHVPSELKAGENPSTSRQDFCQTSTDELSGLVKDSASKPLRNHDEKARHPWAIAIEQLSEEEKKLLSQNDVNSELEQLKQICVVAEQKRDQCDKER